MSHRHLIRFESDRIVCILCGEALTGPAISVQPYEVPDGIQLVDPDDSDWHSPSEQN